MQEPETPDSRPTILGGTWALLILVHMLFPDAGVDMVTVYLAVLIAMLLYREELSDLLSRLRHFRGGGLEITLHSEVRRAEREVEAAAQAAVEGGYEFSTVEGVRHTQEILRQGGGSPWATILLLWAALERAIIEAAQERDITVRGVGGPAASRALRDLAEGDVVPRQLVPAFEALRLARNKVAHGRPEQVSEGTLWYLIGVGSDILALLPALTARRTGPAHE